MIDELPAAQSATRTIPSDDEQILDRLASWWVPGSGVPIGAAGLICGRFTGDERFVA